VAVELGSAWRNGDGGGVSGLLQSIPSARRRREARRSWGLARRRPGGADQRGEVTAVAGSSGPCGLAREREAVSQRGKKGGG
jgi:hypothetical protein